MLIRLFVVAALTIFGSISGADNAARYVLAEAEYGAPGSVISDDEAYGLKVVAREGAYQPMMYAIPPTHDGAMVIWARYRGASMQLKAIAVAGDQTDLDWAWDAPSELTWVRVGKYSRAKLGTKVMLMRGPSDSKNVAVDALLFAFDDQFNPDSDMPSPVAVTPVNITVHWNNRIGSVSPMAYGLNAFQGFDPLISSNPAYANGMAYMSSGLVRLHNWGMMGDSVKDRTGWIDTVGKRWDKAKVQRALAPMAAGGKSMMVNIPGFPAWLSDGDGFLIKNRIDEYAAFCADLVRIVNIDGKRKVKYWEVTNEQDGRYFGDFYKDAGNGPLKDLNKPDRISELIYIYNRCAVAMKKVDPTIKIGGPAAARPDVASFLRAFVKGTSDQLDFLSYHAYATGNAKDSDTAIYDRADYIGRVAKDVRNVVREAAPDRNIPVILDEYNISWTWETRDVRMTNSKGAIFDALVMVMASENGAVGTTAWNEMDGIYGKVAPDYKLRPSAHLFHLMNRYFVGERCKVSSTLPSKVVPFAVYGGKKTSALLLVNRSSGDRNVRINSDKADGIKSITVIVINDYGVQTHEYSSKVPLNVGAHSIAALIYRQK